MLSLVKWDRKLTNKILRPSICNWPCTLYFFRYIRLGGKRLQLIPGVLSLSFNSSRHISSSWFLHVCWTAGKGWNNNQNLFHCHLKLISFHYFKCAISYSDKENVIISIIKWIRISKIIRIISLTNNEIEFWTLSSIVITRCW